MLLYLLILLLTLIGLCGHDLSLANGSNVSKEESKRWRFILWSLAGAIIIMDALRLNVGLDTTMLRYHILKLPAMEIVKDMPQYIPILRIELLFSLLRPLGEVAACVIVQGVFALLFVIPFTRFVIRYTNYWFLTFLIFYIVLFTTFNFEVVRQAAATGIFLWSWKDYIAGNNKIFVLKVLLAAFIHFSAIFLYVILFLQIPKVRKIFTDLRYLLPVMGVSILFSILLGATGPLWDNLISDLNSESYLCWVAVKVKINLTENLPVLNWKGWAGYAVIYLVYPVVLLYALRKFKLAEQFIPIAGFYAVIGSFGIIHEPIARLNLYIFPILIVATTLTFPSAGNYVLRVKSDKTRLELRRLLWCLVLSPWLGFYIHSYFVPIALIKSEHCYDKYYPYTTWANGETDARQDSIIVEYLLKCPERESKAEQRTDYHFRDYEGRKQE